MTEKKLGLQGLKIEFLKNTDTNTEIKFTGNDILKRGDAINKYIDDYIRHDERYERKSRNFYDDDKLVCSIIWE